MSALTKLSVTGSPRKRAALLRRLGDGRRRIGIEPSSSAAATAVAPVLRSRVVREAQGWLMLIRSK